MGELSVWHWLIVAVVVLVLFGYRKLPDAARSIGRSMRIFKAEMKEFGDGERTERADGADRPAGGIQPPVIEGAERRADDGSASGADRTAPGGQAPAGEPRTPRE